MAISHMESDLPFWLQKGIKNERFYQFFFWMESMNLELSKSGLGIRVRRLDHFLS